MLVISAIIATVRLVARVQVRLYLKRDKSLCRETGQLERVEEVRIETIIPVSLQRKVIKAMVTHIHMKK